MTNKQTRFRTYDALQFSSLDPLIKAELVSALEESTPVQQMELIEWLATETPEYRNDLKVPSLLKRLTPPQQMKLVEWTTASMPKERDTDVQLRRAGDVGELNIQKWLEERD